LSLPREAHAGDDAGNDEVEIGVRQNDVRALPAELERHRTKLGGA
jgi:hypothetical protein